MSPRGQWSGRNAGLGLEVQGYVLLLMSSPRWASLALRPDTASPDTLLQPPPHPPALNPGPAPLERTTLPEQRTHRYEGSDTISEQEEGKRCEVQCLVRPKPVSKADRVVCVCTCMHVHMDV